MARKYLTAGLLLVLTLSLTACGTSDKAGTSAHRWDGGTNAASQDWAIQRQADARGPLSGSTEGSYHADSQGRVDGYHARSYDGKRGQAKSNRDKAGDDLKKAGENAKDTAKDLGKAAQDTARSIGDTAEDALDGMKQAAKNATDSAQKSTSARYSGPSNTSQGRDSYVFLLACCLTRSEVRKFFQDCPEKCPHLFVV